MVTFPGTETQIKFAPAATASTVVLVFGPSPRESDAERFAREAARILAMRPPLPDTALARPTLVPLLPRRSTPRILRVQHRAA